MGAIIRSKNTGLFLMFRIEEATWTGKKTAKVVGWTENINNATNVTELCRVADRSEVSRIQNDPDSETLPADFETVTRVTLTNHL